MISIFNRDQINKIDNLTVESGSSSQILVYQAAIKFVTWIYNNINRRNYIYVLTGSGNNGADGFCIAKLLKDRGFLVKVIDAGIEGKRSSTNLHFKTLYTSSHGTLIHYKAPPFTLHKTSPKSILIDALFGIGINRALNGFYGDLVASCNRQFSKIYAVDLPSGLQENPSITDQCIQATATLSFEFPKRAFLLPAAKKFVGKWDYSKIGFNQEIIEQQKTDLFLLTNKCVQSLIRKRTEFSHKGLNGKVLLLHNNDHMIGALIMTAMSSRDCGAGYVYVAASAKWHDTIYQTLPEIIPLDVDLNLDYSKYDVIAIGPGLGTGNQSYETLRRLLLVTTDKLVLDADALNIISLKEIHHLIPENSVITPHLKEFDRLFGASSCHSDRLKKASSEAIARKIYIILKGRYTSLHTPSGTTIFNRSGNPALAKAGSGDILTGVICAFLAQGYPIKDACLLSIHLHGKAADIYIEENWEGGLNPTAIPRIIASIMEPRCSE